MARSWEERMSAGGDAWSSIRTLGAYAAYSPRAVFLAS